jgi:hypothetical protein
MELTTAWLWKRPQSLKQAHNAATVLRLACSPQPTSNAATCESTLSTWAQQAGRTPNRCCCVSVGTTCVSGGTTGDSHQQVKPVNPRVLRELQPTKRLLRIMHITQADQAQSRAPRTAATSARSHSPTSAPHQRNTCAHSVHTHPADEHSTHMHTKLPAGTGCITEHTHEHYAHHNSSAPTQHTRTPSAVDTVGLVATQAGSPLHSAIKQLQG